MGDTGSGWERDDNLGGRLWVRFRDAPRRRVVQRVCSVAEVPAHEYEHVWILRSPGKACEVTKLTNLTPSSNITV